MRNVQMTEVFVDNQLIEHLLDINLQLTPKITL